MQAVLNNVAWAFHTWPREVLLGLAQWQFKWCPEVIKDNSSSNSVLSSGSLLKESQKPEKKASAVLAFSRQCFSICLLAEINANSHFNYFYFAKIESYYFIFPILCSSFKAAKITTFSYL